MLMSSCSFSSLNLLSTVTISSYISSKNFFLKREVLSDARVSSITKKENSFTVHFLQRFVVFKVNI